MARLQGTLEAERATIHQLNTQLREKDQRLQEKDELVRLKAAQLQQKDSALHQRNVEVSRLQRELQVCVCVCMYQEWPDPWAYWVHMHTPAPRWFICTPQTVWCQPNLISYTYIN